jgi:hypothetical protein
MAGSQDPAVGGGDRLRAGHGSASRARGHRTDGAIAAMATRSAMSAINTAPEVWRGAQVPRGIRPVSDAM